MNKERLLYQAGTALGLLFLSQFALSKKQRKAILERDDYTSQMRHYDEERGWHTDVDHCEDNGAGCNHLNIHHITPQRIGGRDEPDNLITLYTCQHTGKCPDEKIKKGYYIE